MKIRDLFDPSKDINRRIEKVITFDETDPDRLRQEVTEYVATDSIERSFEKLLDQLDEGMGGGTNEIGVWVSGFYGSGKSSFTKYLGFALDPDRKLDGRPFLEWLQARFTSQTLRQRLTTVAKRHPTTVIMLDLASQQLAGAAMKEVSSVLYSVVMQWAGYSRERKIAYLEYMLEKDGRLTEFELMVPELAAGKAWREIHNQPLVLKTVASKLACRFYPEIWSDPKSFNDIIIDEAQKEDDRVREMIDLIRRRSGRDNILFMIDEVGQYVAARDALILNLDGLAKNIRNIGGGRAWLIATAQQTLTEDDPKAHMNTAKLFKLKDRFPIPIDLEASDIKEICVKRLLGKSPEGEALLKSLFATQGPTLRLNTKLANTRYYKSEFDQKTFCDLYPFLPQHFDILLELLSRLAKTSGGIGLRSAIKVIQDVLVDQSGVRPGQPLLADQEVKALANTVVLFDTMRRDIQRSFRHIVEGVDKVKTAYGEDSIHTRTAKSIAVLQVLEDFPVSRENLAALMYPYVGSPSLLPDVKSAVEDLLNDPSIPLNEVDNSLRFMSEAVTSLENEKRKIILKTVDFQNTLNGNLREIFTPPPNARLLGSRTVNCGVRIVHGGGTVPLLGDKEEIQMVIEFVPDAGYESKRQDLLLSSQHHTNRNTIFLAGPSDPDMENLVAEIFRCKTIYNNNRNKPAEKEVKDYLEGQFQRADDLAAELRNRLVKSLARGSFVFRGKPSSASELHADLKEASKKILEKAAEEVFAKYGEAPIMADSSVAENFLKTDKLEKIASKDDPLQLVKKIGKSIGIDMGHKALMSIRDYLDQKGQTEGRKLLDDFYSSPYGWSKDTTRYLVAAMLTAGEVKLRVSGQDIKVRGEVAIQSLKNTVNFNKIGIALIDEKLPPETLLRASERLLDLTGDSVMPLPEAISKTVMKHFPDFQHDFSPLATQLKSLGLPGVDTAESIQDSIAEILKGDASDAANRLGCEPCGLFDDLLWAHKVKKSFDNDGIELIVKKANRYLSAIPTLPASGVLGQLIEDSSEMLDRIDQVLKRSDFFNAIPDLLTDLKGLDLQIEEAGAALIKDKQGWLANEKTRIEATWEYAQLSEEDRIWGGERLNDLKIEAAADLAGIQKVINDHYSLTEEVKQIEKEIKERIIIDGGDGQELLINFPGLPVLVSSQDEIDRIITELQSMKAKLGAFAKLRITWNVQE